VTSSHSRLTLQRSLLVTTRARALTLLYTIQSLKTTLILYTVLLSSHRHSSYPHTSHLTILTMTTPIDINIMDVDTDHSSSGISDTSQVSFVNEYETLPASGPSSHAHIIDLGDYAENAKDDGMIKLQDAIVTILFCTSAETLKTFLSPTVNTFRAIFGKKGVQLVIWRKGLEVFVSGFLSTSQLLL
jgi:hypothetical protein